MNKESRKIEWSNDLSIDQGVIDADHKYLFDLVNDFISKGQQFKTAEEAYDLVHRLSEYSSIHFRREESLLEKVNFPHTQAHKAEHSRLEDGLAEIQRLVISTQSEKLGFVSDMMGNLIHDWLVTHIRKCDLPMKIYIDEIHEESEGTPPIEDLTLL